MSSACLILDILEFFSPNYENEEMNVVLKIDNLTFEDKFPHGKGISIPHEIIKKDLKSIIKINIKESNISGTAEIGLFQNYLFAKEKTINKWISLTPLEVKKSNLVSNSLNKLMRLNINFSVTGEENGNKNISLEGKKSTENLANISFSKSKNSNSSKKDKKTESSSNHIKINSMPEIAKIMNDVVYQKKENKEFGGKNQKQKIGHNHSLISNENKKKSQIKTKIENQKLPLNNLKKNAACSQRLIRDNVEKVLIKDKINETINDSKLIYNNGANDLIMNQTDELEKGENYENQKKYLESKISPENNEKVIDGINENSSFLDEILNDENNQDEEEALNEFEDVVKKFKQTYNLNFIRNLPEEQFFLQNESELLLEEVFGIYEKYHAYNKKLLENNTNLQKQLIIYNKKYRRVIKQMGKFKKFTESENFKTITKNLAEVEGKSRIEKFINTTNEELRIFKKLIINKADEIPNEVDTLKTIGITLNNILKSQNLISKISLTQREIIENVIKKNQRLFNIRPHSIKHQKNEDYFIKDVEVIHEMKYEESMEHLNQENVKKVEDNKEGEKLNDANQNDGELDETGNKNENEKRNLVSNSEKEKSLKSVDDLDSKIKLFFEDYIHKKKIHPIEFKRVNENQHLIGSMKVTIKEENGILKVKSNQGVMNLKKFIENYFPVIELKMSSQPTHSKLKTRDEQIKLNPSKTSRNATPTNQKKINI